MNSKSGVRSVSTDLGRILAYLKPYRSQLILGIIFIVLSNIAAISFPYMLKKMIDSVNHSGHVDFGNAGEIALLMILILALRMIFSFFQSYFFSSVGERALADIRKDVYSHILKSPIDFFVQRRTGELISRITADSAEIKHTLSFSAVEIVKNIVTCILGTFLILYISSRLALIMIIIILPICMVWMPVAKKLKSSAGKTQDKLAESGTVIQETFQGISNVKSFTNETFEIKRYSSSIDQAARLSLKTARLRGLFVSGLLFCIFSSIVFIVWYGSGLMQKGVLSFGDLTAFIIYMAFLGGSVAGFAELYSQVQKGIGSTKRLWELLDGEIEKIDGVENQITGESTLNGHVKFQEVFFSYPSFREKGVLKEITFELQPGQKVAIVGPSGAGKSTIISLLQGFYKPDSGMLFFDGKNAESIPLAYLRKQISVVTQDIMLFGGSITENISYGKLNATQQEIELAAKNANAHEFIMSLPDGYETKVGDRGVKLSGGQRQRIAIARAVLKSASILILDEATNSLDSKSEALIHDALRNLMKDRTTFVITHRLSTLHSIDKIIVLDDGVIKEIGTHEDLMSFENGLYRRLVELELNKDKEHNSLSLP